MVEISKRWEGESRVVVAAVVKTRMVGGRWTKVNAVQ